MTESLLSRIESHSGDPLLAEAKAALSEAAQLIEALGPKGGIGTRGRAAKWLKSVAGSDHGTMMQHESMAGPPEVSKPPG